MNKNPNDFSNDNYFENMLGGGSTYNNSYKINDKQFVNDLQNSINKSKKYYLFFRRQYEEFIL